MVDFRQSGKCPHCGTGFGYPAGYGPRAEEEWMEREAAEMRFARRENGCLGPLVVIAVTGIVSALLLTAWPRA